MKNVRVEKGGDCILDSTSATMIIVLIEVITKRQNHNSVVQNKLSEQRK